MAYVQWLPHQETRNRAKRRQAVNKANVRYRLKHKNQVNVNTIRLSMTQVAALIEQQPVYIGDVTSSGDPLSRHVHRFYRSREARLKKVQKMSVTRQNEYYRELGYF